MAAEFRDRPRLPVIEREVDAMVLDLGGVIVEIDFTRAFSVWARFAGTSQERIAARFSFDADYAAHERGEIDAAGYFAALRRSLAIQIADAQFLQGWNAIFVREMPGIRHLLERAAERVPLYLFSNTNAAHRACWEAAYADALRPFREIFTSCGLGLRKPGVESFLAVADRIALPAKRIAFLDDLQENVDGAAAAGLKAFLSRSVADTEALLERLLGPPGR